MKTVRKDGLAKSSLIYHIEQVLLMNGMPMAPPSIAHHLVSYKLEVDVGFQPNGDNRLRRNVLNALRGHREMFYQQGPLVEGHGHKTWGLRTWLA